jgi:endo-1,4-beta-xylanase
MHRRRLLAGLAAAPLALAACGRATADASPAEPVGDLPPLKAAAPFPLGVAAMTEQFDDPRWSALVRANFDRVTPEWEMKAESVIDADGREDWTRADRIVALAGAAGLKTFGNNIVWYEQVPVSLKRLDGDRRRFAQAFGDHVRSVAGRYAGKVVGWDVVNEAIADDGSGVRTRDAFFANLGVDYIRLAFEHAREADPRAVLFLNDYNLEQLPGKRGDFLRLAEGLLAAGAPLGGLGTQTHVPADLPAGRIAEAVRDLGALGLPVHISELDVSLTRGVRRGGDLRGAQARLVAEAAEAMLDLPEPQRFGLTVWGARDRDSWINRSGGRHDAPLLFDDDGAPNSTAAALITALN